MFKILASILLFSSVASADCLSEALDQAGVNKTESQISSTPLPSDGSGNLRIQVSVFGTKTGVAVIVCTPDASSFLHFDTPFNF